MGAVVVSSRRLPSEALSILRAAGAEVVQPSDSAGREWLLENVRGAEVLLAGFSRVDSQVIDAGLPSLKLIVSMSSGVDHIDVDYAEERGVCVANQPEAIAFAVAEHAVMLALAALRGLVASHVWASSGEWASRGWPPWARGGLIRGSTVGVVGLGRIGSLVALYSRAMGASKILYWSRRRKPELEQVLQLEPASLERLFRESDVVVVALPRAPSTKGMIRYKHLSLMKSGAVLVNVGRGGVVDENDLARLLRERDDVYVALDVFEEEPLPPGSPLAEIAREKPRQLILTPHHAGASPLSWRMTAVLAARQAAFFLERGEVWNPVNGACRQAKDIPGLWDWASGR